VHAFRNKQNTPINFNQPNVVIEFEKNSNPSQKPYMGIAKKKLDKKTPLSFSPMSRSLGEQSRGRGKRKKRREKKKKKK
jgi:hypothetical protein